MVFECDAQMGGHVVNDVVDKMAAIVTPEHSWDAVLGMMCLQIALATDNALLCFDGTISTHFVSESTSTKQYLY